MLPFIRSIAKITEKNNLLLMHNKADLTLELTDIGPKQLESTTFFDLAGDYTNDILLR